MDAGDNPHICLSYTHLIGSVSVIDADLHVRPFPVPHTFTTPVLHQREFLGAEDLVERVPEDETQRTVQHKVDGRIQRQQRVRDLANSFHHVVLLHVAFAEEGGHDGVGSDADDEDDDDGDKHQGDSVPGGEFLPLDTLHAQNVDDARVEVDEDEDRDDASHEVLDPRVRHHHLSQKHEFELYIKGRYWYFHNSISLRVVFSTFGMMSRI